MQQHRAGGPGGAARAEPIDPALAGPPGTHAEPVDSADGVSTLRVPPRDAHGLLAWLKRESPGRWRMLYDLTVIDERQRRDRPPAPRPDFTLVYHLLSLDRSEPLRVQVPLEGEFPSAPGVTGLWPSAAWYEREAWDMFGVRFDGHARLRRLLMPADWRGHPLRREHPARATEMGPFDLSEEKTAVLHDRMRFHPHEWGLAEERDGVETMFLNLGPQHPGTHGVLRLILQLEDERIVDLVADIGFHHRAAEKMAERQSWHTYIPYTDRVDYLGGTLNNMAYLTAVERLAGIEVPPRAAVIRILLCELFRIASHLVWYGTFAQDLGALSPVFYMFSDRERVLEIIEAVCGFRMHPGWFRIGGVAADLPQGWDGMVRRFLEYLPPRLREYDAMVMGNAIFRARTRGVGAYTLDEAIDWGVTGPGLRACGLAWDARKRRPYGGYDQLDFEVPTAEGGDCYARAVVRVEEMRQSLRIIRQCLDGMPEGPVKADHPLTTPPPKDRTLLDIETLIDHFLNVSWGPVIPAGEAASFVEASKGMMTYFAVSDGDVHPYRMRIRAPSFPHLQMLPVMARGLLISDLMAILGSIDFVMGEVDR
ncbi:MAG TPA: NADH-quinone oxidoreductase subunit C/D [Candidatus Polarisedimenticolia bacterium]|nr:NADH-quinone oxidoreductase subunit C/D [Candidatus Polarisedimenticolia bacterium]